MAFLPLPSIRQLYYSGRLSQYLLLLACVAGVIGLLMARALIALSPVVGVLATVAQPNLRRQLACWLRLRTVWFPALLYLFLLMSGLYTSEWSVWRHELFRQLPLLVVPYAFGVAVPLTARQRLGVGSIFVLGVSGLGIATLGEYLMNAPQANEAFGLGQSMPSVTGVFHIHFSIMLALAVFIGMLLSRETLTSSPLRWLLRAASIAALLVLHVLAYRTGLLVFYVTLLLDIVLLLVTRRKWRLGLILGGLLLLLPWTALQTLESARQRLEVTRYDLEQFSSGGDINNYSLSKRLAAWQTANIVFQAHPLVGVAPADVRAAMMQQYAWQSFGLTRANWVMVHNQYLHYLVGGGLLQLGLWLLVLLGPLAQPAQRRNPYVVHSICVLGVAMLTDSLLELQIGFNLFVFLYGFLVVSTERQTAAEVCNTPGSGTV
ncbi:O-antigen ligase family protein [Hymenobacter sp. BT730]|uniref:O-antigen ligase family protein n=1 Tax=Hymenobacter sp. BT730 TaxID=3063332 RepID=UPI0026DF47A4|nr:O-antigen ligase family protein [Hymenobacter sp. BT730]